MDFVWKNKLQIQIIDNEFRNQNIKQWLKILQIEQGFERFITKIILQKKSKIIISFSDIFEYCKLCEQIKNDSTLTLKTSKSIQTYPISVYLTQHSLKTNKYFNRCTIDDAYFLQYGKYRFMTFKLEHPTYDGLKQTFVVPVDCNKNGAIMDKTNASINVANLDHSSNLFCGIHIELRHALDCFVHHIDQDLSKHTWKCNQCKTLNSKITKQCYNCPCIVSEENDFKSSEDKNYFRGQSQSVCSLKHAKYEKIDEQTKKWYGDVNGYCNRYEPASYFFYDFIDSIKNFGSEIALPFYHHPKFENCYCSELYWLGVCNHIFVKTENKNQATPETLSIFETNVHSNQDKMKKIVDAFCFVDDDGIKTTQIFFALLSKLTNYNGWIVEDISNGFVDDVRDFMDEELVTSQQIVHCILNMDRFEDINQCIDLDKIEEFVGLDDTFFVMDITPLRHIVYTSKSGHHQKYLKSETFKKVKEVQKSSTRLGGTILYRFCHENQRKKFKFDCNHRQMLQKMNFITEYPVYIGGIEHQFVTPLNSKSHQIINVNDADVDELDAMMERLSIKSTPNSLNKSGYAWSVLDNSFGPNPFDEFTHKKKAWIDYALHQRQERQRKKKAPTIKQASKKRKLENGKTEKIIAADEKEEIDLDFDDIDDLDMINFSALSLLSDEKNNDEHNDVCIISDEESDDEFAGFMKDKRKHEFEEEAKLKKEESVIKIKEEKEKDVDYIYNDADESESESEYEDEYDSDDTDLEYIDPIEASLSYKPVMSVPIDSGKMIGIRIYNKALYHLAEIDTTNSKWEQEFDSLKKQYCNNQNRKIEHSHLRSGRTTVETELGGAEPVYWKYPNLRKRIDQLMDVFTPLEYKKNNGQSIDLSKYHDAKKGILIYCLMLQYYHIHVINGCIEPWIFDEDIYKKDRKLNDANQSDDDNDDDDVDL